MTIIKKFEPTETKKRISRKYLILVLIGIVTLILVQIGVSNNVIAYGEKYDKLSVLEKSLLTENQILENEIAKYSSLKEIASRSAQLGFSASQNIQYIR